MRIFRQLGKADAVGNLFRALECRSVCLRRAGKKTPAASCEGVFSLLCFGMLHGIGALVACRVATHGNRLLL
jgi:hypothetical protein